MPTLLRRLLLWTAICSVSAAPSFYFAHVGEFNHSAMVVGVCLFILAYTAATSTAAFERLRRRPFVRRTLYIGYGLRLFLSALIALGPIAVPTRIVLFADAWPGYLSVMLVKQLMQPETFSGTLLTTIVQGALLNIIIFIVMLLVYGFQRLFLKPPADGGPAGFDVIMPAPALPVERSV